MRKSALKKLKFPEFVKMISATDFMNELKKLLDLQVYDRWKVESVFGITMILDPELPAGTALLLDKNQRIVAVIQDKKVVEIK